MPARGSPPAPRTLPVEAEGLDRSAVERLRRWLRRGFFPGCVTGFWEDGRWRWRFAGGWAVLRPRPVPMRWDTLFDGASLTKPLVTARKVLEIFPNPADRRRPVTDLDPTLPRSLQDVTLHDFLRHGAGYLDWAPLYLLAGNDEERWDRLCSDPALRPGPAGPARYSCLDYQWLGLWLERLGAAGDAGAFGQDAGGPSGGFSPPRALRSRCAGTEVFRRYEKNMAARRGYRIAGYRWDRVPNWGRVHDLNAFTQTRGRPGNAGLFANAEDLVRRAEFWFREDSPGNMSVLAEALDPSGRYTLGWQWGIPGCRETRGLWLYHTGFTGVCLALRPDRRWVWLLLTNRIHPRVRPVPIQKIRRAWFRASLRAAAGA